MNPYLEDRPHTDAQIQVMILGGPFAGLATLAVLLGFLVQVFWLQNKPHVQPIQVTHAETAATTSVSGPLYYEFKIDGILEETGSQDDSSSPYFWLNSGGMMNIANGVGETNQGQLGPFNMWRIRYAANDARDTDGGRYPQNLFRLVTRGNWDAVVESVRFKLTKLNMTDTPNRDGYSGVLLMSRYQDGMNLYYAGIRMDGTAVIKKKYQGTYYTLAEAPVFTADAAYNKDTNPNLIPGNTWMGLRTETRTQGDGSVMVALWIDKDDNSSWQLLLTATDTPGTNGAAVLEGPAHTGIRTDYLDVLFDDYKVAEE